MGLKRKQICERGDEFCDWDAHAFHFIGGMPLKDDGSTALYAAKEQEVYLEKLTEVLRRAFHALVITQAKALMGNTAIKSAADAGGKGIVAGLLGKPR